MKRLHIIFIHLAVPGQGVCTSHKSTVHDRQFPVFTIIYLSGTRDSQRQPYRFVRFWQPFFLLLLRLLHGRAVYRVVHRCKSCRIYGGLNIYPAFCYIIVIEQSQAVSFVLCPYRVGAEHSVSVLFSSLGLTIYAPNPQKRDKRDYRHYICRPIAIQCSVGFIRLVSVCLIFP